MTNRGPTRRRSVFGIVGAAYMLGALYLYAQARAPSALVTPHPRALWEVHHPGVLLDGVMKELDASNFSNELLPFIEEALRQVPSSYRASFFLAAYHGNRLEAPELTKRAFEASLLRFPANGRLHFTYGAWLFDLGTRRPPWAGLTNQQADSFERLGEGECKLAVELEPDLSDDLLQLLSRLQVPAERWAQFVSEEPPARYELWRALAKNGHLQLAAEVATASLRDVADERFLSQAAEWALRTEQTQLAVELAARWQAVQESRAGSGAEYEAALVLAKAYLSLGDTDSAAAVLRRSVADIERRVGVDGRPTLELRCAMGYEYVQRGRLAMAQSLFSEVTRVAPGYAPGALGLARVHRLQRRRSAAAYWYRRVLRLDPSNAEASRELSAVDLEGDPESELR